MKTSIKNFLQFKGRKILFCSIDGTIWVAIKPICEILKIDHRAQLKRIKNDEILGSEWSVQTMQIPNSQKREMAALPLFFLFGWLFSIKESSLKNNRELIDYKWECYRVLYNHFNGYLTQKNKLLQEHYMIDKEIKDIDADFRKNERYQRMLSLSGKRMQLSRKIKEVDHQYIQHELFPQN